MSPATAAPPSDPVLGMTIGDLLAALIEVHNEANAAWQAQDRLMLEHAKGCKKFQRGDDRYCDQCRRRESETYVAAHAVQVARTNRHTLEKIVARARREMGVSDAAPAR